MTVLELIIRTTPYLCTHPSESNQAEEFHLTTTWLPRPSGSAFDQASDLRSHPSIKLRPGTRPALSLPRLVNIRNFFIYHLFSYVTETASTKTCLAPCTVDPSLRRRPYHNHHDFLFTLPLQPPKHPGLTSCSCISIVGTKPPPPPNLITRPAQVKPSVSPATALAINDGKKHRLPYPPSSPCWIPESVIRDLSHP